MAAEAADTDYTTQLLARIKDLEAALGQNDATLAASFDLSPKLSDLLGLLLKLRVVTSEVIQQRLGVASDPKVAIHRLRKAMARHGVRIEVRRGFGYWIGEEDKARIREKVTSLVTTEIDDAIAETAAAGGTPAPIAELTP